MNVFLKDGKILGRLRSSSSILFTFSDTLWKKEKGNHAFSFGHS